jgi:hypothetical protein
MRLRPLTIGHLDLLHESDSPFVTHTRNARLPDLEFAVAMCAQSYAAARDTIHTEPGWWEKLRLEWVTWRWARLIRTLDFKTECERFSAYLLFHQRYPNILPIKGETRSLNSPRRWRLRSMLSEKHHLGWEQASETPVLRAHCLWATQGDREGWLNLEPCDPLTLGRASELLEWARTEDLRLDQN